MKLEELKKFKYKMKYADECNYIMQNMIPESGQANSLQGELLRECEKLRDEAQRNGNYNWDEWFEYFCIHIRDSLCEEKFFSEEEKQIFTDTLNYFKSCGEYAKFIIDNDDLPDDYPVDLDRIAYIDDNLYDIIADAVGRMHYEYKREIPYTINPDMYR